MTTRMFKLQSLIMTGSSKEPVCADTVRGFSAGREDCFNRIFRSWYPELVFFGTRITGDPLLAEDIVEEVFIRVWERRDQFDEDARLRAYLYKAVRNAALTAMRLEQRRDIILQQRLPDDIQPDPGYLEHWVEAERKQQVYAAMENLPTKCRRIMKMIFIEGKNSREVAHELKLSLGTVKTQKARGIKLLRDRLSLMASFMTLLRLA